MIHQEFDPGRWFDERLSHLESCEVPLGNLISGAESAVSCHLTRNRFWDELVPDAETAPAHVFVWGIGESNFRHLTKIGGLPYWPREEEWPLDVRGAPIPFLAQICFADSRELFSFDLPGDVLLIFAESHRDSNRWVIKWQNIGLSDNELVDWNAVRCPRGQVPLFAHLWKSRVVPDWHLLVKELKRNFGGGIPNPFAGEGKWLYQFWANQICRSPFCTRPFDGLEGRGDLEAIGCLAPISISSDNAVWPLINCPHAVSSSYYRGPTARGRVPQSVDLFSVGSGDLNGSVILYSPEKGDVQFAWL